MNVKEKINVFSQLAIKEAEGKRDDMMAQINDEFEAACREYERDARKAAESDIREQQFRLEKKKHKEILAAKADVKKSIYELQSQLIDELFSKVEMNLGIYVETEDYVKGLLNDIRKLSLKYRSAIELYVCARDTVHAEKIKELPNITIMTDDSLIGGFRAVIPDKGLLVDCSYSSRLDSLKTNFGGFKALDSANG